MENIQPRLFRIDSDRCLLDKFNPRLLRSMKGKGQEDILEHMKKAYYLEELALSLTTNGYFEAEPLVAIPAQTGNIRSQKSLEQYVNNPGSKFIIVEGNRRLATIKGLQQNMFLDTRITEQLEAQIKELPIPVFPNRNEVSSLIVVHHLAGVRKWNVYERARYIVHLRREQNKSIAEIQNIIGDRKNSAKKTYICYRLIELVEEFDKTFSTEDAIDNFPFLQLATGQGPIKDYLHLKSWQEITDEDAEHPIPKDRMKHLKFLFECLFDNGSTKSLIRESRDITSKLSKIFADEDATAFLEREKNIDLAYDMIGGPLLALINASEYAESKLKVIFAELSAADLENQSRAHEEEYQQLKENINTIARLAERI